MVNLSGGLSKMILRLVVLVSLGCLATAGPITWEDSKCSQYCPEGSTKYQLVPGNKYVFSYESVNELQADRTSELVAKLTAAVSIIPISKCEMVLEFSTVTSDSYHISDALQKHPLHFAWNDGRIEHVCPHPEDSDEITNLKKSVLSNIQNTMRTFEMSAYNVDTDILGSCDTSYKAKEISPEKFEIVKTINIPSCSNHLKGQTVLLSTLYESSSHRQHLPFLSDEKASCKQIIDKGIIKEVRCDEEAYFKPLSDYGYVVKAIGHTILKKLSVLSTSTHGEPPPYRALKKENLVFKYQAHSQKSPDAEDDIRHTLNHICENSADLITKEEATYMHKLVYTIRQMDAGGVERVYEKLKNNDICNNGKKVLTIYIDALRMASSGGSIALLSKLAVNQELSQIDALIWLTLLPFTSYVEEESVAALIPLLSKGVANRQTLLGATALVYKYCSANPECESSQAVKDFSTALKEFLGDKCSTKSQDEETEVLTALKAFGNLGYFGERANDLFDCALTASNKMTLKLAAIDAFRRSPCKEEISSKLLEIYSNKNEHDEIRIAALMSLIKCPSKEVIKRVVDVYSSEASKQVEVFTWTLLNNIRTSQDPAKSIVRKYLNIIDMTTDDLKRPKSIDMTKYSRNFDLSFFSSLLNLGISREANLIHTADSFIPRSGNIAYKVNAFGNQLEPIEVGAHVEDLEHILEKVFGPVGILSNIDVEELIKQIPINLKRSKRAAESYESKINALSERLGYQRNKTPHGTAFVRIMGHELGLLHLNEESLKRVVGFKAGDMLKHLADLRDIDTSKNLLFLDFAVLFPSLTGRAYKLASNDSITIGMKAQGKIDFKSNFPIPEVDIDGKFKPSILAEVTASFTIHGDSYYEPGVKVETVLNAGLDYQAKLELKDGRLVHVKLTREQKRSEILNLKRTLYYMSPRGKKEMEKPPSHNFNYCTKYLQKITGAQICASLSFPHAFDGGKFKIPFVREIEASIVVEQTDPSMDGYELLLEIPNFNNMDERRFRFLVDTPNSARDRKFSLDYSRKMPDANTHSVKVNLHTPFYTLDATGHRVNREDNYRLNVDITGDGTRRYSLNVDAAKVVKGARLIEYQPKITVSLPSMPPMEFTGTVVFSKGRKAQLSINMESRSFSSPFTIKGNLVKEGDSIDLSSNWKLNYEFNVNALAQIHRFHAGIGYDVNKGMIFDGAHHYEPDGRSYESVTYNIKIDNIKIFERLSFSLDTQVLFAEHQDLNTMLKWDFSFKPLHHLKNDLIFRYGENFEDDTHLVRLTFASSLHGDFNSFHKLGFENKAGLTISCLDIDKSASLSTIWDFVDDPKFIIEAGVKTDKDKEIKFDLNYRHIEKSPLKLATDFTFTYNTYKFKYRDEAIEVSPKTFQWKSVIEPTKGKEINTDFIYRIKNQDDFHHELEGTIQFPGFPQPVKQKGHLQFSETQLDFKSNTDFGRGSIYEVLLKLKREGNNELKLNMPFVEGYLTVDATSPTRSIQADFRSKGDNRRIILNGKVTPGDTNSLDLDVQWDADRDPEQKVTIQLTSSKENDEGIDKYVIGGSINFINSIDISGAISTDLIKGPHFFRAEFSGNVEPMATEFEHEIKDGHMTSVIRYFRSGVEKIRADIKGKLIYQEYSHFEIEGGLVTSSPYKTFDGKSIFFRLMADSTDDSRTFVSEYRLKFTDIIGYEGKIDYQRKRGWPGFIKSNLLVTVHNRALYTGNIDVDYGSGKYSCKISFTPITKKKIHFLTSFEHASHFAAFHHSLITNLQLLQTVDLNAVADLRNMEDAKMHSNLDINSHKLYDANSTLKIRSIIDFDIEANIFSKITPSLKMFSKAQASGQVSKFDFNLNVDSKDIITGSGEIKKRKRGFNSDLVFKYKEKDILNLIVTQDGKGKHERNYFIKSKFPSRTYTATVKVNKEKKGIVNYDMKLCRNEELCINIDATHKEYDNTNEWQINYKRGDIEFSIERIRESSKAVQRFHTVIYKGDNRFGYDVRFGGEGPGKSASLGIILPSREIVIKGTAEFSLSKPRIKFDLSADGRNNPDRELSIDVKFENHLMDSDPSKFDIIIAHPTFEKPIEIKLSADYERSSSKYFTAEGSLDYSSDPEDKLIGKLSIEDISGTTDLVLFNIYHKDEQHLDFVVKVNATSNSNEDTFTISYNWKDENDADTEAYMTASHLKSDKRMFFVYHRPKLNYRLDGKIKPTESLLNNTCEIDLESAYNGRITKGKLVSDYETGCYKLTVINDDDEISRTAELCVNLQSRKLLSLISEGMDDEGIWTVQYLLEIVQKDWNTIGFRQQINPEFLGSSLFQLTAFADELEAAGVGTVPFYDSPRFKIIRRSFSAKVWEPFKQFVVPEAQKFSKDIVTDSIILQRALMYYYSNLPSFEAVKEYVTRVRMFIRSIAKEIWANVYSYYEGYVSTVLHYIDKFREIAQEKCENNVDCRLLVKSYQTGGWKGLLAELKNILLSLPDKIQQFLENPGTEVSNYFRSLSNILKALLHPLTKYRCGEIVVKVVKLSYEFLQPRVQAFLSRVPNYYSGIRQRIATNEYIQASFELLKKGYLMLREEILSIDYQKIIIYLRKHLEDYLSTIGPPAKRVNVNELDVEKGILDVDINDEITTKLLKLFGMGIRGLIYITERSVEAGLKYNWNTLLIKFKRIVDLDFIPPYDAQAVMLGHQHFVTFDKVFYDFAGECSYLLTRDFHDGNFTLVLKPKEGDEPASILVLKGDTSVEITSGQTSVKVSETAVQLPYITKHISVTREGYTVVVNTKNGFQVKCNLIHQICTFRMSGWYYGKTAGLLGTYNYEEHDEFKRPKGQIANSVNVFAKSWELKKGCKTNNLVPDAPINKNAEYYKTCRSHFVLRSSPLAACFSEVPPDDYFNLCVRYLALDQDHQKALCNVAAAYVTECEKNYVELNLPSKCLKCDAPDGSKLEHGDRKKFEKLNKKSVDTVFIVEDHECNKVLVRDLGNFARSIEKELQNEGFRENMFGVVGYGGEIGDPQIFTAKDKIFFNSRDVSTLADMFKLESKKIHPSKAFDAIKHAVTHLSRGSTAKSFVLLSCSTCKYDYTSLQYPIVQQILLERGIGLHVIKDNEIPLRKSSVKEKNIIGVDPDTVFYAKDVTQKDLVGTPELRSHVIMPKDLCIALSQDVNGSFFSTYPITKASSSEVKNFRSVFSRKFLKSAQLFSCQWCDCTSTRDHLPNTVCQPCEIRRPRLPFSVGSSNAHTRTLEAFISYLIHVMRE